MTNWVSACLSNDMESEKVLAPALIAQKPPMFTVTSTHNLKSRYRLFVAGDTPAHKLDLTDASYEVCRIPSAPARKLWKAMKLYADSVNFVYFPGNETLQSEFEHEIVASSHPATPRTVSCISEFLACIQPQ